STRLCVRRVIPSHSGRARGPSPAPGGSQARPGHGIGRKREYRPGNRWSDRTAGSHPALAPDNFSDELHLLVPLHAFAAARTAVALAGAALGAGTGGHRPLRLVLAGAQRLLPVLRARPRAGGRAIVRNAGHGGHRGAQGAVARARAPAVEALVGRVGEP